MSPATNSKPVGPLADAIKHDFGSFEQFKLQFVKTGKKLFGSGWVWLAREHYDGGKLQIHTTTGHDNPMMQGLFPILLNDVWEHAYYLKYENRREDYLNNWWAITNWEEAARRFEQSGLSAEQGWEDDSDHILRAAT
jgi:Fe-Mn family superoxide dismutase